MKYPDPRCCRLTLRALASLLMAVMVSELPAQDACPCSIWGDSATPTIESSIGTTPIELGVRFRADEDGYITALRFYKGGLNTGTHVGSLWTNDGSLLARVSFQGESAQGWQEQELETPVEIKAGVNYVASYHTTVGRYAFDTGYFLSRGVDSGPLHANQSGDGGTNGLYANGSSPTFPTSSYNASNYWVDVVFVTSLVDSFPPEVVEVTPLDGSTETEVGTTVSGRFGEEVDGLTIDFELLDDQGNLVPGSLAYEAATLTATFTPYAALAHSTTYAATIRGAVDLAGNTMAAPRSWLFTTADPDLTPPSVTSTTPASGDAGVSTRIDVTATFDEAIDFGSLLFDLESSAGFPVASLVSFDLSTLTATLDPEVDLEEGETYTASVYAADLAGNPVASPVVWSFTITSDAFECPCSIWDDSAVPTLIGVNSIDPVELGIRFRSSIDGFITGIRFHKAPTNTGLHVGSIWSPNGALLARTTFVNETPDGWQTQLLDSPLAITAGTTYIVSYHARNGNYSVDLDYFDGAGFDNDPLRALADGEDGPQGVYGYNIEPIFPSNSFRSANYWVDVVYTEGLSDTQAPFITTRSPVDGATDVAIEASISARFNEEIDPSSLWIELSSSDGAMVPFTFAYDSGFDRVTITPEANLLTAEVYEVTVVSVNDLAGNAIVAPSRWSFTTEPPDAAAPLVVSTAPSSGEVDVPRVSKISATFDERILGTEFTFTVVDEQNASVEGSISYDDSTRTVTFDPELFLRDSTSYTVTIAGAEDLFGNVMSVPTTWSFTTVLPVIPAPEGPGGPILIVSDSANPFGRYLQEILLSEGRNLYRVDDISNVDLSMLESYEIVILGEMPLTSAQASLFSTYVFGGGRLIAMRPDPKLAGLFGLVHTGGSLANAYLAIDTALPSGAGLVSETMQFHSEADLYDVSDAIVLATMYSDKTTATTYPVVTRRSVGSSGGVATAFAFDLARSIVYTRQGNPAWVGQERDNFVGLRSTDLFIGSPPDGSPATYPPEPDWLDLDRSHIPQADEQQRFFTRLIVDMLADRMPLPRFWYFPSGHRAVVVMTGDDHASGGTIPRFADYAARSDPDCSVDDWECIRSTSYVYSRSDTLTDAEIAEYQELGFEIAIHFDTACVSVSKESLAAAFESQIAEAQSSFPSMNPVETNRMHCVMWTGWIDTAKVQLRYGVRLDTNYYHDPETWIANYDVAFVTGSGLPQRFADLDGSTIDSYQVHTHMNDETGQAFPQTIDGFLDGAIGADEFFGAFCANIHTDVHPMDESDAIVLSAQSRGVPVVSSKQLLDWLDGRNGSSFQNISWDGQDLSFEIVANSRARNLEAYLPSDPTAAQVSSITRDGAPIAYAAETVKGRKYAVFAAESGSYLVSYQLDTAAPVISNVAVSISVDDVVAISWMTDELSTSAVRFGTDSGSLDSIFMESALVTSHTIILDSLLPSTEYFFRVESTDFSGNVGVSTEEPAVPYSFTTGTPVAAEICVEQTTAEDFSDGSHMGTAPANSAGGELTLAPTAGSDFNESSLPAGWQVSPWLGSGDVVVSGGVASVDAALLATEQFYGSGRSLEFVATFTGVEYQHVGFAISFTEATWAIFSTGAGGQLLCRTASPAVIDTPLGGSYLNAPHVFRIEWNESSILYYVDDTLVATHEASIGVPMRPVASDYREGQGALEVDDMRFLDYVSSGTYESPIFDAGVSTLRGAVNWESSEPAGTTVEVFARIGDSPTPDGSWTPFLQISSPGLSLGGASRYLQYRVDLSTSDAAVAPSVNEISFTCPSEADTTPPVISGLSVVPGIDGTTAMVSFLTNELTSAFVAFGIDPADLSSRDVDSSVTYEHAILLTNLIPETTYHLVVTALDGSGNSATEPASPLSFSTPPLPPDPGPVIASIIATPAADGLSATVTWITDLAADSRVDYGLSQSLLDRSETSAEPTTAHSVELTGLANDTTYFFRVSSRGDGTDTTTAPSAPAPPLTFTTPPEPDVTPPVIGTISVVTGSDAFSASVTWTTDEPAESLVEFGTSPTVLDRFVESLDLETAHSLILGGLSPVTTYYYRVIATDSDGNMSTRPDLTEPAASFVTPELPAGVCISDTSASDFDGGTHDGTETRIEGGGEIALAPAIGEGFDGSDVPDGWLEASWSASGLVNMAGGEAIVDGSFLAADRLYPAGRSLEFVATFDGSAYQHVGFCITFTESAWAIFSTGAGGQLLCRTAAPAQDNTQIDNAYLGSPHRYRIDWNVSSVDFFVDDALVASHPVSITANMRPGISDFFAGGGSLAVDSLRMTPYTSSGSFTSRAFDGGYSISWDRMTWTAEEPAATSVTMHVRYGDTPTPDSSWTSFVEIPSAGDALTGTSRYIQYRADLSTTDTSVTPTVLEVEFECPEPD